jgi:uncharacterized integral membrane protein (TIGR00698 family)
VLSTVKTYFGGFLYISVFVGIAFVINAFQSAISPLALCVGFGFLAANLSRWPRMATPATNFSSKTLMRIGVALLGAQVSVTPLKEIGIKGVATIIVIVATTIFGILILSKIFGMSGDLGLLIGVGFGVCGATAVAAIRPQTRASAEETSYAIALISLCGTLSIFTLPLIGHLLNLDSREFGYWVGAAVHDVGQVVATASIWGDRADQYAILVKLTRVCLLGPIVLLLAIRHRRWLKTQNIATTSLEKIPLIPFFIIGFISVAVISNLVDLNESFTHFIVIISKIFLGAGLVALGSNVRWKSIRAIGSRPIVMGLIAWILVAGISLVATKAIIL